MRVTFPEPEKMNLIAYFLRDLLQTRLWDPQKQAQAQAMQGAILFQASNMQVVLEFGNEEVAISPEASKNFQAKIRGDLAALLDIAAGAPYFKFLLLGRLRIGGNLLLLLKLLKVLTP